MMSGGRYEELGAKVRRAQSELDSVRGVGTIDGVTVEVGADNTITSITGPRAVDPNAVLEAYRIALGDKQPRVDSAMREVLEDARISQISTFTDMHSGREPAPARRATEDEDGVWEQIRQDPLGRRDW
ncbi:MAG: YbaB/EbfC family nucleoid-associated protein [Rhodococcus sp.]|nr:YbaB/EbfC family nucleoid-associated protein [Rhodococcus sp. (in: high G+C Gram-positive bacteria)]